MTAAPEMLAQSGRLPFALEALWLVPLLPLAGFLLGGLVLRPLKLRWLPQVAAGFVLASLLLSLAAVKAFFGLFPPGSEHPALVTGAIDWLPVLPGLSFGLGTLIDPVSLLLLVVVCTVSFLVHLYSIGYMADDPGKARYFVFLNLFTFSMLGLVLAPNLLQLFVCWELVGASSFLLIGFYFDKPSAVSASKKAFIVTRFADLGLLLGLLSLAWLGFRLLPGLQAAGAVPPGLEAADFALLNHPAFHEAVLALPPFVGLSLLSLPLLLLLMGAAGKSAMFPLHIWLPDAMEGPTPVSALIHAATMVVAGIYLVARLFPAFAAAVTPLEVAAFLGALTCLFAAVIACSQDDIKRVLAFSTLSQLGYMLLALGVARADHALGHTAGLFHLFTHAFFKSLLFLGAGAVIHAVHSNDIWRMGGLRKKMPLTHISFLVAVLAIAGLPPLAGFFSKDEILRAALEGGHTTVYGIALAVAALTPFYMARIYLVAFGGTARSESAKQAHEAPAIMTIPLLLLALLSVCAGWLPMAEYIGLDHGHAAHHGIHWNIALPATAAALLGLALAGWLYTGDRRARREALASLLGPLGGVIRNKFYIDEIWLFFARRVIFRGISAPIAWFDRTVVDGAVNAVGWLSRALGASLTLLQSGQLQGYASWMLAGTMALVLGLGMLLGGN